MKLGLKKLVALQNICCKRIRSLSVVETKKNLALPHILTTLIGRQIQNRHNFRNIYKKLFIVSIFVCAIVYNIFAESLESNFTKDCVCKVMSSSANTQVTFFLEQNESELKVFVSSFSYKDKSIGEFSFVAQKKSDGIFYAQKQVAKTTNASGEEMLVTISSAKIDVQNQSVELKFKPGKMPFNINLQTL